MSQRGVIRRLVRRDLDGNAASASGLEQSLHGSPEILDIDLSLSNYMTVENQRLLNLASNNYLGLANDPRVIKAAITATQTWGTSAGSSPLLSGYTQRHEELALYLSAWKSGAIFPAQGDSVDSRMNLSGTHCQTRPEREPGQLRENFDPTQLSVGTLLFPCGYSANLAAMTTLLEPDAQVFCDRKNHASLIDGLRLACQNSSSISVRYFRHQDFDQLSDLMSASSNDRPKWIVTDSVFSMDGTITKPGDLSEIANRFQANVIADEAHATGVLGPTGNGLFSFAKSNSGNSGNLQFPKLVIVGTLSKALAASGGFITADKPTIDSLVQSARSLTYSTALPPASVAAALEAARISCHDDRLRSKLIQHVHRLHVELAAQGWQLTGSPGAPLLSVIVGSVKASEAIAKQLYDAGIYAPAIRPPTVKPNECRIRLSPTASMSESQIDSILNAFDGLSRQA